MAWAVAACRCCAAAPLTSPSNRPPTLDAIRTHAQQQLTKLHPGIKRFDNPHQYPAGLELSLHDLKTKLILRAKGEVQ